MMTRSAQWLAVLAAALLAACGGGGDGGGGPTGPFVAITGSVAPPASVTSAPGLQSTAPTPPTDLLLPPNASPTSFPAIAQSADYALVVSGSKLKAAVVRWGTLDTGAYVEPFISANGWSQDTTIGKPNALNILTAGGVRFVNGASLVSIGNLGAQPAVQFQSLTPFGALGSDFAAYVLPHSAAALNATGYTYQTYGGWNAPAASLIDGFFSTGVPTTQAIATSGQGTYAGQATATLVDATTGDISNVAATVSLQIDFAARTVTFSTTATTSLSVNALPGAVAAANPPLNLSGVLAYAASTNTFTGAVTSLNGMGGNVTGRFYGPVLSGSTASKAAGSPTELGGTFAVSMPAVGTLQGAFGAQ